MLGGRQFLITRPRQHSSSLARKLRDLGAQVLELPAIRTEPAEPNPELAAALERFGTSAESWLVFTSPIGVATFLNSWKTGVGCPEIISETDGSSDRGDRKRDRTGTASVWADPGSGTGRI